MNQTAKNQVFLKTCFFFQRTFQIVRKFPSKKFWISQIAVILVQGIVIIPTVLLNLISVITISKSSQLKGKTCYFLILIQSVVDFAVGLVGIPLYSFFLLGEILGTGNCVASFFAIQTPFLPCGLSLVTLSAMTVERYIGVLHPYCYKTKVTKKKVLKWVAIGAVIVFTVFGLSFHFAFLLIRFFSVAIPSFLVLCTFAYGKIYLVVRRLARSERRPAVENPAEQLSRRKKVYQEIKHAKSCFLVVLAFIPFLLPLSLSGFFVQMGTFNFLVVRSWSITLIMMNSSANSIIFFWTKKLLRKEAFNVLRQCILGNK